MFINYVILALSVSIDSLGIGITYGLKNTVITNIAKIILFVMSILITTFSICFGNFLNTILPSYFTNYIGSFLLMFMGLWVIYQALNKDKKPSKAISKPSNYEFIIKSLGITIQILRNPIYSDLDNSKKIDMKEALYLGIALSIDSICVGICSSALGFSSIIFPFLVAIFQLFFLSIGGFLGKKITNISKVPENIWNVLSGILLICIGISKFML